MEEDNRRLRVEVSKRDGEIDFLRAKINHVTALAGLPKMSESAAMMPRMAQKILHLLMEREFVAHEVMEGYLYAGKARSPGCIKVHVARLRKLLPTGVTIKTNRGVGYYIPKQEKIMVRI